MFRIIIIKNTLVDRQEISNWKKPPSPPSVDASAFLYFSIAQRAFTNSTQFNIFSTLVSVWKRHKKDEISNPPSKKEYNIEDQFACLDMNSNEGLLKVLYANIFAIENRNDVKEGKMSFNLFFYFYILVKLFMAAEGLREWIRGAGCKI